ncbi:MAG: chloride channel protein [Spirochaetes bacterium]|nr:chloride channel protein [Spirochaetota bacterium]
MEQNDFKRYFLYLQRLKDIYSKSEISLYIFHIFLSIILGILAGSCAIFFHFLLEKMRIYFEPENFTNMLDISWIFILAIPVSGSIIVASASIIFKKVSHDKGVTGVIKALILNNGHIPLKNTVFHFLAPVISIGTGAPLGPEGPAAKMGSGIGSFMSQLLKLNKKDMKMYTAAGAGAAISAIFNAPIAGVFFGIEVMLLNDLKNQALSALIIASVVADILSRSILGPHHIISIPHYSLGSISQYPMVLGMGIISGMICIFYFWFKKKITYLFDEKLRIQNQFLRLLPVALIFGILLINYYSLFGIGYDTISDIISNKIPVQTVSILLLLKLVFLALFLAAGSYGGSFAPSLSIGVMLGFTFANLANYMFGMNLDPVVFSLIGMGGILAGINSIPLTSILLVFEITNDYKFILPLMLVSIISYLVTLYYNKGTVYANDLLESGIDVSKRGEIDILGKIRVSELMRKTYDSVSYRMPVKKLINILLESEYGNVIVTDDDEKIMGMATLNDIRQALLSENIVELLIAGDIVSPVSVVSETDKVSEALHKIEIYDIESIPVVSPRTNRIVGMLTHQDITHAYNTLLHEWETDQFLVDYSNHQ